MAPRTPKLVIDQAIRENRQPEYLCYGFATLFVLAGVFALCGAMASSQWPVSSFTLVLAAAPSIREDNMAIRLLEITRIRPPRPSTMHSAIAGASECLGPGDPGSSIGHLLAPVKGVSLVFMRFQTCIHCPLSGAVAKVVGRAFPGGAKATRNWSPLTS